MKSKKGMESRGDKPMSLYTFLLTDKAIKTAPSIRRVSSAPH